MDIKKIKLEFYKGSIDTGYLGKLVSTASDISLDMGFELPVNDNLVGKYRSWCSSYENMVNCKYRRMTQEQSDSGILELLQNHIDICTRDANALVISFNKWLESEGFRKAREAVIRVLQEDQEGLIIVQSSDKDLWQLPWYKWEIIQNYYRKTELIFATTDSSGKVSSKQKTNLGKVKILSILGDDTDLELHKDKEALKSVIKKEEDQGLAIVKFLEKPERRDLVDILREGWDFMCFSGHSKTEDSRFLIKINQQPLDNVVDVNALSEALRNSQIQIAVFNSCDSLGMASVLQKANISIPYLLLMSKEVPDHIAQKFFSDFLQEYCSGKSFYLSVREARSKLEGEEGEYPCATWLPTIVQRDIALTAPTWEELVNKSLFQKLKERWLLTTTTTAVTVFMLVGGWFYARSINLDGVSWSSPMSNQLNPYFRWEIGGDLRSSYKIESSKTLIIATAPGTDHNKANTHLKQSPRLVFPIKKCDQNFEATVKVKFNGILDRQRAVFGISDPGRKNKYMYIYAMEGSNVEAGTSIPGNYRYSKSEEYKSEVLHLKIQKTSESIKLLYSENNWDWKEPKGNGFNIPKTAIFTGECELYFEVLSTNLGEGVIGKFIDFSFKLE
jgi:CHAT domain